MNQFATEYIRKTGVVILLFLFVNILQAQDKNANQVASIYYSVAEYGSQIPELEQKLNINIVNQSIEEALFQISSKTNLEIAFDSNLFSGRNVNVTIVQENMSVADALLSILAGTGYEAVMTHKGELILKEIAEEKEKDLFEIEIRGNVTDSETGEPLPGVNIVVLGAEELTGSTIGTQSNMEGAFSISVPEELNTLVFSYIGYRTKQVEINGQEEVQVELQPDVQMLDDVVVVGYGTQEQIDLTGSVSSISSERIESRPASNLTSLLQGTSPGVTITQSSGRPGQEGHSILIRGVGTMNNAQPMVIVDGVESSMNDVNPQDVESISVLKDASSASIYGSRAANGVILITTKRGEAGTLNVNYNTYIGRDQATRLPDYVSSAEYAELYNEANRNQGLDPRYSQNEIDLFASGEDPYNYPNTPWLDLLLQGSGFTQYHNLSFSGGSEINRYRISMGYNEQKGLLENTNSERYNLRVNFDSQMSDWFDFGLNTALSRRNISNPSNPYDSGGGIFQFFRQANRIPPIVANKYEDGSWDRHDDGNPIAWVEEAGMFNSNVSHIVGSVFGRAEILEGLSLRGSGSADYQLTDSKHHFRTIEYGDGSVQGPNQVTDQVNRNSIITLETILDYVQDFGPHGIEALAGASRRYEEYNMLSGYRQNFPSNDISELTAGSQEGWQNNGSAVEDKLASYFGRINYNYDRRYLIQANIRRDGSSKFARGNRWGWFPSFSAGWRISEESFMQDASWLSELKLRASWGMLGNNRIGNYQYIPLISLGRNYNFGGSVAPGAAQTSPANEEITWETTTEVDIGIDAGFLGNRLTLTLDYYDRFTDDILTSVPVSDLYGLPAPTVNAGAMRNKGVEFEIGMMDTFTDFQYNVSFHGAFNDNVVERYENPHFGTSIRAEGVAWNSYYGYEAIGQFQSQEDVENSPHIQGRTPNVGDLKYKDQNGDGVIDGDDRVVLGNTIPEITFGLNLGAEYKGVDISMFFQGADRVYRTIHAEAMWPFQNGAKVQRMHLDRTIVENGEIVQHGHYPRVYTTATSGHTTSFYEFSSFSVLDASYIRLKNLQVGYTLPMSWLPNISNARVYFSGENLFTLTGFPGNYDPETPNGVGYPQIKTYTLGLNITF
jgi:TonB-linked SusC/RagA family outer membrane protein